MTRPQARNTYKRSRDRHAPNQDFFCLAHNGIRVWYPSPKLLNTLTPHEREQLDGRVVWASTANPFYALRGIHPGASLATAAKHLNLSTPFHIGLNYWYTAPNGASTAIVKARHGTIQEIGIADKQLTPNRKDTTTFSTASANRTEPLNHPRQSSTQPADEPPS
jgi:hypothetical protein